MHPLRRLRAIAALGVALGTACAPGSDALPSDARKFAFRAERVPVGRVFHYEKSNIDGTQAIHVAVYVVDTSRIEMVELEPASSTGVLVSIALDWASFSATRIESRQLAPDGSRDLRVQAWLADGEFTALVGGTGDTVAVGRLPVHMYNLSLVTLAALFPHLDDPEGTFTVGILSPTFGVGPGLVKFAGPATVRFAGEAPCHATLCRRYEIAGPGVGGAVGTIWVQDAAGVVERIEIPFPTHPRWRDFKLELERSEAMTPAAWAAWIGASLNARPPT